ncbi:hypothetical protein KIL84_001942 [Mauremys mutica]|uniref:NADH dehydrogenase [ubiquinone] 1 beta subcomplex subunit 9 n=1 Tax=Mauremys mutica TaxID=74926 RepID=A0A9D3XJD9_9SAUR|nr:hypothetical protein KIL84_001942 [Mauremys mutica]
MAAYLTHQQKVMQLYKRAMRHLESWCIHRDKYRFFACVLRERFEEHKNEKDMVKTVKLLRAAGKNFGQSSILNLTSSLILLEAHLMRDMNVTRLLSGSWISGILLRRQCILIISPKESNGRGCG